MRNHLKERLAAGKVAIGTQLRFGSPAIAELCAAAGFDYVIIDGEHAPQTPTGVLAQLHAVNGTDCTPIMRLGRNDPDEIRLYLDMGAGGVLIPLLRTAEDAEKAARACRLPPVGTRSFGPSRAYRYGVDKDWFRTANDDVLCLIIIETADAVENIDAILAVPGLDGFVVGPADLSIELGVPMEMTHPRVHAATEKVLLAAKRAGKYGGMGFYLSDPEMMKTRIAQGAQLILAGMDEAMMREACERILAGTVPYRD
jgi:2-dehydro-3-deoxyglucarate aldolase